MKPHKQDLTDLFVELGKDWPSEAIIGALKRKGFDLRDIEKERGLKEGSVRNVFYRKCPSYQVAIAQKIGVPPAVIWPSRYSSEQPMTA
ncbi:transcriptional regulator [Leminorella grimontii]|uniref:Transcriptional regulator n=1 Tax=Leminorella grimontii TaxID=82981 RepID=A0AAV5N6R8_9GAMM|nr:helix-turn-helix domain-containing protein [Leminorella grimontii]KFC94393.1 DNA-binding repressor [Leminorella grimontii ATCC 33999 = DSM 5078]GKX57444.1 transcriptional regulator [Leminorella grimontii]VFS54607.1 DNA-binding transcriptional regulator Nlp [Leminorella grimontii]